MNSLANFVLAASLVLLSAAVPAFALPKEEQIERKINRITEQADRDADKQPNPCKGLKSTSPASRKKACDKYKADH